MNVTKTRKTKSNLCGTGRVALQYSGILTSIFEFMLTAGVLRTDIRVIAAHALEKAKPAKVKLTKDLSGYLSTAALILDAWHRNRRYLDSTANPRAVPLVGPAPSVEALVRTEPGIHQPAKLARRLMSERLVVPCGKGLYRPASSVALLTALNPIAIQHVARSLTMLLETIRHNLAVPNSGGRLLERIAEVPDLPLEDVRAFREFTRIQGWVLLRTVNDWLEARRTKLRSRRRRTVRAGIHVHSYVGAPKARSTPTKTPATA